MFSAVRGFVMREANLPVLSRKPSGQRKLRKHAALDQQARNPARLRETLLDPSPSSFEAVVKMTTADQGTHLLPGGHLPERSFPTGLSRIVESSLPRR